MGVLCGNFPTILKILGRIEEGICIANSAIGIIKTLNGFQCNIFSKIELKLNLYLIGIYYDYYSNSDKNDVMPAWIKWNELMKNLKELTIKKKKI